MTDERAGLGDKPASDLLTDQFVQKIGQQILDTLAAAGLAAAAVQRRGAAPAEVGRVACAFASIEDPRVRAECLSLIEAISGSPNR